MCGRFALTAPASAITEIFQVDVLPDVLPRYNIAPTTQVAAIVEEDGTRQMQTFKWGLIPFWAKDKKIGNRMINARGETVASKPAFRAAFKKRRVLIIADGFYEWTREGKKKLPHLIGTKDGKPFAMAGLWERWTDKETDEEIRSCSIITIGANELMAPIHNRMPVILDPADWDTWLDESVNSKEILQELIRPFPAEGMKERRVSMLVNNVRNQGPELQDPFEGDDE